MKWPALALLCLCPVMLTAQGLTISTGHTELWRITSTATLQISEGARHLEFPLPEDAEHVTGYLSGNKAVFVADDLEQWRGFNVCVRTPHGETCADLASLMREGK